MKPDYKEIPSQKKEMDLNSINLMLKNSFGAIKIDMIHLKEAQEEQLRDMASLKKELKEFKSGCATKEDIKRLKDGIDFLEENEKALGERIDKVHQYATEVVEAVNERIQELNGEFKKILTIRDELIFKLKSFDKLEDDFKEFRKTTVTKTQLQQVIADMNGEFDKQEQDLASKRDLLKLAKRVEKLEKK
ncbi:MAG: hypothetical protein KJ574_00230 [Nanoarchaeota archaeon]|nr:hypothetical protein [Nanoarchaeota archaeon]